MAEATEALCFGDLICLFSEQVDGFVFAHHSSEAFPEVAVRTKDHRRNPEIGDPQTLAFQICAANRYKLQKAHLQLQEKAKQHPEDMRLKAELAAAEDAAMAEKEDNRAEQLRLRGKRIVYGQMMQLQHVHSGKLLHISARYTSVTESSNMRTMLEAADGRTALLRIMPRYKVKAEGDLIQVEDQVVVEGIKASGQYLHVSRSLFGEMRPTYADCHELNTSVRRSGFTIYRHYKWRDGDEEFLTAGMPFRLFHADIEAYLTAEGVFGSDMCEEAHLRVRVVDPKVPRTLVPPTSAVTYWQLEMMDGAVLGDVVRWEQQVRIRHMCSRRFLMIDKGSKAIGLTLNHTDPQTVFKLHPVIKDGVDGIQQSTFCRISHALTGFWLSGSRDDYVCQEQKKSKEEGDYLAYSRASLKQIVASATMMYSDAYTIQKVEPELLEIFNHMAGMVPIIQTLLKLDNAAFARLTTVQWRSFLTAFREMQDFQIVHSDPCKDRQKLLRNLRMVDLLVQLLQRSFTDKEVAANVARLHVEAYRVINSYLVGNSRKNEMYMFKHLPFFLSQITIEDDIGLKAIRMVTELIRDNRKLVDRIHKKYIDQVVGVMSRRKHKYYLDFLEALCVCDGINLSDNQKEICEKWLIGENKTCVFHTDLGQELGLEHNVVYVSLDNKKTWVTLISLAVKYNEIIVAEADISKRAVIARRRRLQEDEEAAEREEIKANFQFLMQQLNLFGQLCQGRNDFCINVITRELKYLTWEEAFLCLTDAQLTNKLRAKYCEIIINLFIDVGKHTSKMDQITLTFVYDAIAVKDEGTIRPQNRPAVEYTGRSTKRMDAMREWIARYLDTHKDMTASLIDENQLIAQVLRVLHYLVRFGYYQSLADLRQLIPPLLSLTDGRNDKPYRKGAHGAEFERIKERYQTRQRFLQSPQTKAIVDAKRRAMDVLELLINFLSNTRLERFIGEFKFVRKGLQNPAETFPELHPLLSETYDLENNAALTARARHILREVVEESAYFSDTNINAILMDLSNYQYDSMVNGSMWLLHRLFSVNRELFTRAVVAQVLITEKSIAVFRLTQRTLPILRRLIVSRMSEVQVAEVVEILTQLRKVTCLEGRSEEPHPINQTIIFNSGIIRDIIDLVTQGIDFEAQDQYAGHKKVIQESLKFMRGMAVKNPKVQDLLFRRLDFFLKVKGAESELAKMLTEVFSGNQHTCMRIMPNQIRAIMDRVVECRERSPELLDLLNAIVKIEELNLPLKRNQTYVMKYFMQFRAEVGSQLDGSLADLRKKLKGPGSQEAVYIMCLVDLLATCAEGENRYIESVNQTIFNVDQILEVLNDEAISCCYKSPFLRFLLWVYLNVAGGHMESGGEDLPHNKEMWRFLSSITNLLSSLNVFAENDKDAHSLLQKKKPSRKSGALSDQRQMRERIHFCIEAVFPFVKVFFSNIYEADATDHSNEFPIVDELALSFINLSESILPIVDNAHFVESFISALQALMPCCQLPPKVIKKGQNNTLHFGSRNIRSKESETYHNYYQAEQELNVSLNIFAMNFSRIYGGKNTVQDQIGFPSKEVYTVIGGDDELPLAEEFQEHVQCFIDESEENPSKKYASSVKLVMQLQNGGRNPGKTEKAREEVATLTMKSLQLLRAMIHNERLKLPSEDAKRMAVGASRRKAIEMVHAVQDALNSHDTMRRVLPLLMHPSDLVVREVLSFLVGILEGGNLAVQRSLFSYFSNTREEIFFFCIRNRMSISSIGIKEKRSLMAQYQARMEDNAAQMKKLEDMHQTGSMISIAPAPNPQNGLEFNSLPPSPTTIPFIGNRVAPAPTADPPPASKDREDLDFKDDGYIEQVLRVLAYICDGQNEELQNYMREQPDNIKSVNLVAEVAKFLEVIYSSINPKTLPLMIQIFSTLNELAAGNKENQAIVFDNKVCDYINFILRSQTQMSRCDRRQEYELKHIIAILISCLIEENVTVIEKDVLLGEDSEDVTNVPAAVTIALDAEVVKMTFVKVHSLIVRGKKMAADELELITKVGFRYFHILKRLADLDEEGDHRDLHKATIVKTPEEVAAWDYFEGKTQSVEILKNDVVHRVYFRVDDTSIIRPEVMEKFKYEVDRSSPSSKLHDLTAWTKSIVEDVKYQRRVSSNCLGYLYTRGWFAFNVITIFLSFVIAILILISWSQNTDLLTIAPVVPTWASLTITVLGALHNFFAFNVLISFMLSNHLRMPTPSRIAAKFRNLFGLKYESYESFLRVDLLSFSTLGYLIFFGLSLAGSFTFGYLFAFHLVFVAAHNQLLTRVIQAVTKNGMSLILVGLYSLVFFYIYALLGFAFFRNDLSSTTGMFCENMWKCYLSVIHRGLVSGLHDGAYMTVPSKYHYTYYLGIMFYQVTGFILITTIGLNIVFGIIVDTFSELRDSKWNIDHDIATTCFICSLDAHGFERYGGGFHQHVTYEHCEWSYVFYILYLDATDRNDLSGIELYVYEMFQKDSIDYYPLNRSLTLQNEEEDETEEKINALLSQVKFLVTKKRERELMKARDREAERQARWSEAVKGQSGKKA